jgi:hypothetical protein
MQPIPRPIEQHSSPPLSDTPTYNTSDRDTRKLDSELFELKNKLADLQTQRQTMEQQNEKERESRRLEYQALFGYKQAEVESLRHALDCVMQVSSKYSSSRDVCMEQVRQLREMMGHVRSVSGTVQAQMGLAQKELNVLIAEVAREKRLLST